VKSHESKDAAAAGMDDHAPMITDQR